ncbi:uncharacterized protein LOC132903542 [Amyelois transitella]|uniref:uncharacterized protein LOC132903542 n=1 Tax=Amyelois transitella TaxID=680683 RepID=UPI00298F4961|nr:uncharacterized protein LOC132903542 [Amyelois transitella]
MSDTTRYFNQIYLSFSDVNLLIGGFLTDSFVLLTANVEDLKQIAKKFLSASLTEQLTDFLAKGKSPDQLSEENERNAQEYRNSRELIENNEPYNDVQTPAKTYSYDINAGPPIENVKVNTQHVQQMKRKENRYRKPKPENADPRQMQITYSKDTNSYEVQPKPSFPRKQRKIVRLQYGDEDLKKLREVQAPNYRKLQMTTLKQRNEFDQYDNHRNNLVATSGYLGLPRVE